MINRLQLGAPSRERATVWRTGYGQRTTAPNVLRMLGLLRSVKIKVASPTSTPSESTLLLHLTLLHLGVQPSSTSTKPLSA